MAEKEVLFSRAFRGYKRRDVNAYIAAENSSFAEKEAVFAEEKKRLAAGLAEKDAKIDSLNEKIRNLEVQIGGYEEKILAAESALSEVRASLELYDRNNVDVVRRLEENLVSERVSHDAELARVREECREKLEMHDIELERIREEYRAKEEARYDDVVRAAYELRDRMATELRKFTKNCLREVMRGVDEMRSDADRATFGAEEQGKRINVNIDSYEENMKNEVRRILDEFKKSNLSDRSK